MSRIKKVTGSKKLILVKNQFFHAHQREKVKSYTNPKGYQAIQDHGNQPKQIPM